MKREFMVWFAAAGMLLLALTGCGSSGDLGRAETQREVGVRMARMNLWREAGFRFARAVEIDPNDAKAHNNLAVAHEANGDFEAAAREYREAMRLDRSDQHIQKNYSRFVEFTQKAKKRDEAEPGAPGQKPPAPSSSRNPDAAPPAEPAPQPPPPARPPGADPASGTSNGGSR